MRRRTYLTSSAAVGAGLLAGCLTNEEGTWNPIEDIWEPGEPGQPQIPDDRTPQENGVGDPRTWRRSLLTPDAPPSADYFGYSVSVDGETALIGAPYDDDLGGQAGAAYVFDRRDGGWRQSVKLLPDDEFDFSPETPYAGMYIGQAVHLDGDTAVVGNPGENQRRADEPNPTLRAEARGAAYVFVRSGDTWAQQAKLLASDFEAFDHFGSAVSVDGDTLVVGVPNRAHRSADGETQVGRAGATYVFTRRGASWTQAAKLVAGERIRWGEFGQSVDVDGDTVVVGQHGSAHVFTRSGGSWTRAATLSAGEAWAGFGRSVSVSGDTVLVGQDVGLNDDLVESGAVYVFTRDEGSWSQQARLLASDAEEGMRFGGAIDVDGDVAIVGADGQEYYFEEYRGKAYVFTREGDAWTERATLYGLAEPDPSAPSHYFGCSVSLDDATALVGAYEKPANGAAYAFDWDAAADGDTPGDER